jgi:hypothetical protein
VLDLLESFARERDVDVRLERRHERQEWVCVLTTSGNGNGIRSTGESARAAIRTALEQAGVELPS